MGGEPRVVVELEQNVELPDFSNLYSKYLERMPVYSKFGSNMETSEIIAVMLAELKKEKGLSTMKIEKELKFSNGLLGKAAKGKTVLSDEKIGLLGKFYFDKINEGKPIGWLKVLSTGEIEMGIIAPEEPKADNPVFKNDMERQLWEIMQQTKIKK